MQSTRESATLADQGNGNPQVARLPKHLRQFIVGQSWSRYTPIDHAVWRYIMRQAVHILRENAHRVYFKGLLETGINFDAIPRIEDMNDILGKIGWGAVAVDGFIPPAAFMEYQAYRVLVIACDMRQIHHIEYTPAPDIVHEAAGHAPIIVDMEYADYLSRFGAIGAKAMFSRRDFELYEAIRHLSILKEAPDADEEEIKKAGKRVEWLQANLGTPSEMARLSRLHWWTVEYGLIGDLREPKIYGAGLLSSIGEAVSCLNEGVKKLPYTIEAADYPFDITTKQPQLFVTPDFEHLNFVLEEFSSAMAFRVGGTVGIGKAIECGNASTVVYSSGLQVTGVFTEALQGANGQPAYIRTSGPTALAADNQQLDGHGIDYHSDGFGSPVGKLKGSDRPLEDFSDGDLRAIGVETGRTVKLEFAGGVTVAGKVERIVRHNGKILLITFSDCSVTQGAQQLFSPTWGRYDMAVGEKIVSVFNGAADKNAYEEIALVPKERTIKASFDSQTRRLHVLYQHIRDIRNQKSSTNQLPVIWNILKTEHPSDWLASAEILEILVSLGLYEEVQLEIKRTLQNKVADQPELNKLINDALLLIYMPTRK